MCTWALNFTLPFSPACDASVQRMKALILTITFFFLQGCVNMAVSPAIEGRVTNEKGLPVEATILIQHNQLDKKSESTTTDKDGYYSLNKLRVWTPVPFSTIRLSSTVTVSAPGYKTLVFEADSYETVVRDVQLEMP